MAMEKILIIDDEPDNVRVLALSLETDGYEVITAGSGEEGLARFKAEAPDMVITDIRMPGMDGIELLRRVKDHDPDVEVIIVTGHGDIDSAIEAMQCGASDFINKPVRDQVLAIALQRARDKLEIRRRLRSYTEELEEKVREATREIRRKSGFQIKLIKSSNDGIVATDKDLTVVIYNPGAHRIFGYSQAEVIDHMKATDLFTPEIGRVFELAMSPEIPIREIPWKETHVTSKAGETIPVRFSVTVLYEDDQTIGSVAFFQDLREIRRLERELVRSERLAAVGQTVAGLAHCIKNILHGMEGGRFVVDTALGRNDIEKLKSGWGMIKRNIGRTSDLVLDLLYYSKQREPEYGDCSPNQIAGEVCHLLMPLAVENDIAVLRKFDPAADNAFMDPQTIYRSLLNLVSNAVDACLFDTDAPKVHAVTVRTRREPGGGITFEVTDNGCGMTPETREKLFSSFFSTKGAKGTGLGLLVTRKLVEEHKGSIKVESEEGKGTTFTLRLPCGKPEAAVPGAG
ncbi:MAG: response regulator [Desulfobacterales bacterium]|nr:response regulator [Desulfobacterales bacterium]